MALILAVREQGEDASDSMEQAAQEQASVASRAMRELHDVHSPPLLRFLLKLTQGERQLAEDLLQETFLRAWRSFDVLPTDVVEQRRWLFTVARRVAIDVARARKARPTEIGGADTSRVAAPGDAFEAVVAAQTIRKAMVTLSEDHRAVLVELFYRGLSMAEAAVALGVPEGTVKSRAHYALRYLREAVGPADGD
jgi:RNA polymerase sigma-70 factor (ECF subfamily)